MLLKTFAIATVGYVSLYSAAVADEVRNASCYIELDGRVVVDGRCYAAQDDMNAVPVFVDYVENGNERSFTHFFMIYDDQSVMDDEPMPTFVFHNGGMGASHAHEPLGEFKTDEDFCYVNERAKLCLTFDAD